MILRELTVSNFGPFSNGTKLQLDKSVTVLTGPNDAGKSSALRLLALMYNDSQAGRFQESDVNLDHLRTSTTPWGADGAIQCTATFDLTDRSARYVGIANQQALETVDITFQLARGSGHQEIVGGKRKNTNSNIPHRTVDRMPSVISLPRRPEEDVRDVIDLKNANLPERELLSLAFDAPFDPGRFEKMSQPVLLAMLADANERLNRSFSRLFGTASDLRISLMMANLDRNIAVQITNGLGAVTPLGYRGTGVRRVIRLFAAIQRAHTNGAHTLLLWDEPETSLHSDAQHLMRRLLEGTADRGDIQVVYATHSPAMINPMRPDSVRLFVRELVNNRHATRIINRPIDQGFVPVRASLGISPSDSLSLSPVVLIVEGITEALCLPVLIKKLNKDKVTDFHDAETVLSQMCIWDAEGDHFDKCCGFARSQLTDPVVLLDSDKTEKLMARRTKTRHLEGVPVVVLPKPKEFEDLVPRRYYFCALFDGDAHKGDLELRAFEDWENAKHFGESFMFTKRVEQWLFDAHPNTVYDKPSVMHRAIELSPSTDIDVSCISQLMNHLRAATRV